MKHIVLMAALASLAACSETEEAAADAPEEIAAAPADTELAMAQPMAADGQPVPGRYRITTGDGMVFMEDVNADGTYTQTDESGAVVETGRWNQRSPAEYCYTPDEQYVDEDTPAGERCNTEGVDAAGVWTSTDPDGRSATVERVTI